MSKIEVYHKTSHTILTINPVKVDVAIIETVWEVIAKVRDIFLTIPHIEETNTK
jgi:hypothetical protein